MSETNDGLLTKQVQQLEKIILILLILVTFWLGFTSNSFLLVTQAVLSTSIYFSLNLTDNIKNNKFFNQTFFNFFWLILATFLITVTVFLNLIKLASPISSPTAGAIILVSFVALATKIILIVGLNKQQLKMEFFRENSSWILVLLAGIFIQFSRIEALDSFAAIIIAGYLLFVSINKISSKIITPPNSTEEYQLDISVIDKLLDVPKLEKLHDINVVNIDNNPTVVGNLVVNNKVNQEEIFKIKSSVKKILNNAGFENSILEVVYLAELNNN